MKYLKLFSSHSDYDAAKSNLDKPNVSHCVQENEVHYNPWVETRVVAKFNVTSTSSPTPIGNNQYISAFAEIEVDGVALSSVVAEYQFDTLGEHTVKYTLSDPTSIGDGAFYGCSGLTSVTIPDSVTSIGNNAFEDCGKLTGVSISSSVTSIGTGAFAGCSDLTSISVDSNNAVYDSRNDCNAIIETATNTLISGCKNTIIPNTVTSIYHNAFRGCSSLTSVTIPNNVTSIGTYAFARCSGLTSVTIGNGVTSIGSGAFAVCSNLTSITSLATTAPTIQFNTFINVKNGGTLYVPIGSSRYNTWMGTSNYYLGKYSWTKVEQ